MKVRCSSTSQRGWSEGVEVDGDGELGRQLSKASEQDGPLKVEIPMMYNLRGSSSLVKEMLMNKLI